jgi:5-(carboxyamino)imidazole ribonucleotide synthase
VAGDSDPGLNATLIHCTAGAMDAAGVSLNGDSRSGAVGIVGDQAASWPRCWRRPPSAVACTLVVQTPNPHDPAVALASQVVQADVRDAAATRDLAQHCGAISFENEWIDLQASWPRPAAFLPSLEALQPLICKRSQRELLQRLCLPCPRWFGLGQLATAPDPSPSAPGQPADGPGADPSAATPAQPLPPPLPDGFAYPLMAKLATGGYDGRGTAVLRRRRRPADPAAAGGSPADWIVEEFVAFEQELALVAARDQAGEVGVSALVQTHQHQQVCDWVLRPGGGHPCPAATGPQHRRLPAHGPRLRGGALD